MERALNPAEAAALAFILADRKLGSLTVLDTLTEQECTELRVAANLNMGQIMRVRAAVKETQFTPPPSVVSNGSGRSTPRRSVGKTAVDVVTAIPRSLPRLPQPAQTWDAPAPPPPPRPAPPQTPAYSIADPIPAVPSYAEFVAVKDELDEMKRRAVHWTLPAMSSKTAEECLKAAEEELRLQRQRVARQTEALAVSVALEEQHLEGKEAAASSVDILGRLKKLRQPPMPVVATPLGRSKSGLSELQSQVEALVATTEEMAKQNKSMMSTIQQQQLEISELKQQAAAKPQPALENAMAVPNDPSREDDADQGKDEVEVSTGTQLETAVAALGGEECQQPLIEPSMWGIGIMI